MDKKEFYQIYIPALEKALEEENQIEILDPEFYISDKGIYKQIIDYTENIVDDPFLNHVAYYYDAKTHNFPDIDGIEINEYRSDIIKEMSVLKKKYGIE